ncbi:hypothetical protein [Erythrobacter dokdonensis]|uniref:Lipoprotein n=1 Tax=Erythrobacter dokdonensis DSW-74 TaxID=1300349 RepID=A0A1A7BGP4_9SPHN|nr:hypothetical protein [Erythrobacter dokdonensis]OBV10592.1 hypothetical protein I603_1805 [Erythrobacter dokdonensis DSW-74]
MTMMNTRLLWAALLAASLAACGGRGDDTTDSAAAGDTEAMAAAETNGPPPPPDAATDGEDELVPGTDYNATTIISCGFDGAPPTQKCDAGIKRNWGDAPGEHLVEVTKPDGMKRAIFFRGTEPYGADSVQADGSAEWDLKWTRNGDQTTITFGPETYVVVDAMITGG